MIKSFRRKLTQALFEGGSPRQFKAFQNVTERTLEQLHNAATLDFLKVRPAIALKR